MFVCSCPHFKDVVVVFLLIVGHVWFHLSENTAASLDFCSTSSRAEEPTTLKFVYGRKCKMFVCVQPLMREVVENKAEISKEEARDLIERCLKVLYYRDARSYNRVGPHTHTSSHLPHTPAKREKRKDFYG